MNKKAAGYFFIVLSALIFSTTELTLKSVSGAFAPLPLTACRFLIGGICLIPFALSALKKKGRRLHPADLGFCCLMGFLFVVLSMVVYQMAILRTKASAVAVLFSCNALFATLLGAVFLKEKLKRKHYIALAFEIAAVIVIADPWEQALDPLGVILALTGAVLYAVYLVAGKKRSSELGGVAITCGSALCGSLLLFGRPAFPCGCCTGAADRSGHAAGPAVPRLYHYGRRQCIPDARSRADLRPRRGPDFLSEADAGAAPGLAPDRGGHHAEHGYRDPALSDRIRRFLVGIGSPAAEPPAFSAALRLHGSCPIQNRADHERRAQHRQLVFFIFDQDLCSSVPAGAARSDARDLLSVPPQ